MRISALWLAAAVAFCSACTDDEQTVVDGGTIEVPADAGVPDVGVLPGSCLCEDEEDCAGCIQHIGECCYDDVTIGEEALNIAAACDRTPSCKACCNECKAKSCETLKANGECPNLGQPD